MTTFIHTTDGEALALSAVRSLAEIEGRNGRPDVVNIETVDGRKARLSHGFSFDLLASAGTPIVAASGFAVLWWHPADAGFPEDTIEYPVIAWLIDALGNVRPLTPDAGVNSAFAVGTRPRGEVMALRYPDGRVDVPHEGWHRSQDEFVAVCRKSAAARAESAA